MNNPNGNNGNMRLDKVLYDASTQGAKKLVNMIPGTLTYKGKKIENFQIDLMTFNETEFEHHNFNSIDQQLIQALDDDSFRVKWLNIVGFNDIDKMKRLGQLLSLDALDLEQILNVSRQSVSKIKGSVIHHDIQMISNIDGKFDAENISIFLMGDKLLTFQERQGDVFDNVRERIKENLGHIREYDASYTYYCIMDAIVDHYLHALDTISLSLEGLESNFIEDAQLDYQVLYTMRKQLGVLRLNILPLARFISELEVSKNPIFEDYKSYLHSLLRNIKHAQHEVEAHKETVSDLLETYMMTNADKMNHIMTILTVFSAIFIPLSFIAGVFGMNFVHFPGLDNPNGLYYFILMCFGIAGSMFLGFKLKKWI